MAGVATGSHFRTAMFGRKLTNEEFLIELQSHVDRIKECMERINQNDKESGNANMAASVDPVIAGTSETTSGDTKDLERGSKENLHPRREGSF